SPPRRSPDLPPCRVTPRSPPLSLPRGSTTKSPSEDRDITGTSRHRGGYCAGPKPARTASTAQHRAWTFGCSCWPEEATSTAAPRSVPSREHQRSPATDRALRAYLPTSRGADLLARPPASPLGRTEAPRVGGARALRYHNPSPGRLRLASHHPLPRRCPPRALATRWPRLRAVHGRDATHPRYRQR